MKRESSEASSANTPLRFTLRSEVALGLGLPLLLILTALALVSYLRDRNLMEAQIGLSAEQLGELTLGGLRQGFIDHDENLVGKILRDLASMEDIHRVEIAGNDGDIVFSSQAGQAGALAADEADECQSCHQVAPFARPRSSKLTPETGILRIAMPIDSEPACRACHVDSPGHLGILLLDVSVLDVQRRLSADLRSNLVVSGASALLISLAAFLLTHALVVRRVETFQPALRRFGAGDFSARLPVGPQDKDELGALARTLNEMAASLERTLRDREERAQVRHRAIVEERERIARELHDGLGQLLGYVNTKAMAARITLKKGQSNIAEDHLLQLEQAVRELFTDVRVAILGLKTTSDDHRSFPWMIRDYVDRFSELTGLPAQVSCDEHLMDLSLPAETEVQLLRITQEALTNVRKHAQASRAGVTIENENGLFQLRIHDDGVGFDPGGGAGNGRDHFGLAIMRDRAEAIGAEFRLETRPAAGTCILVSLPLDRQEG